MSEPGDDTSGNGSGYCGKDRHHYGGLRKAADRIAKKQGARGRFTDKNRKGRGHPQLGYLFVLSAVVLNIVPFIYPFIQTLRISSYNWSILGEKKFIFMENYVMLLQDRQLWTSLIFALKYVLFVTPYLFTLTFILVPLVNGAFRGVNLFRTLYFTSVVISATCCSMVWLWTYNGLYGVTNYILQAGGLIDGSMLWMNSAEASLSTVISMVTWKMLGFSMFIILAAFQGVDNQVYEAARVDEAGWTAQFSKITLPIIKPQIALALIMSVTGSVLAFEQFSIMTRDGPGQLVTTSAHYVYSISFDYFKLGYGSTMTIVILLILGALSLFQHQVMKDSAN